MKQIRYDGPGALLRVAGRDIPRGGTAAIPNTAADELMAARGINVTVLADLDSHGKPIPAPTQAAANADEPELEPEADPGEGHPDTHPNEED